MTKIIEVIKEKNKEHRKNVAFNMRYNKKSKKKGKNYSYTDLSPLISKFSENQMIKLSEILFMTESDLIELIILNIDNITIW